MLFWTIYMGILLFVILGYTYSNKRIIKNIFLFFIYFLMIGILGFRHENLGLGDVKRIYMPIYYDYILKMNFIEIFQTLKDPIFYFIMKVISIIFNNFQANLILYAIVITFILINFIKKESKSMLISIMVFFSLNFFGTAFSGLRHIIAMMILIYAYFPYKERNFIKFLLIVLLASCFHITALSFLLIYIFNFIKIKNKKNFVFFLNMLLIFLCIFINLGGDQIFIEIMRIFINLFDLNRFDVYLQKGFSSLNNVLFYINYLVFLLSSMVFSTIKIADTDKERKFECLLNLQFLGTFFCLLVGILGEFNRIAMFFCFFSIILIPENIFYIKKGKERIISKAIIVVLLLIYFLFFGIYNYNLVPFNFFWN